MYQILETLDRDIDERDERGAIEIREILSDVHCRHQIETCDRDIHCSHYM